MKLTKEEIESKYPPIINGTYKKDNPDKEIGYQKWEIRKTHEVVMLYTITAKTKKEAEDILEKKSVSKLKKLMNMEIHLEKKLMENISMIFLEMKKQFGKKLRSVFLVKILIATMTLNHL